MLGFIKGVAALLTAVAAILTALVTIRGDWNKLFSAPTPAAAVSIAVTGSAPGSGGSMRPSSNDPAVNGPANGETDKQQKLNRHRSL